MDIKMLRKGIITGIGDFEIIFLLSTYSGKNVPRRNLRADPGGKEAPHTPDRGSGRDTAFPPGRVRRRADRPGTLRETGSGAGNMAGTTPVRPRAPGNARKPGTKRFCAKKRGREVEP